MHVLQLCSGRSLNGAVLHCLMLSRELRRLGWRVTLGCRRDSWLSEQAQAESFDCFHSEFAKFSRSQIQAAAAEIRQRRVDVVHTHQSGASCFGVLLRWATGCPSVATAHSRNLQLHWMWNDYVIGVSDSTTQYHRRVNLVRSRSSGTVHNFIDIDKFSRTHRSARARLRGQWGVPGDSLLFGPVGDVIPRKGLIHLVRALPGILNRVPQARLLCVGGEDKNTRYARKVRNEASRLGVADHVIWTGARRDIPDVLSALDLYVLPSLEECFPLSILEAMAAGLPCVCSNVGGIPECVIDGTTGLLVPPAQPRPLGEAIAGLLLNSARRTGMADAGRRRVSENFSPSSQAERVSAVLRHVGARHRAAA